jgi:hypothetical protein
MKTTKSSAKKSAKSKTSVKDLSPKKAASTKVKGGALRLVGTKVDQSR